MTKLSIAFRPLVAAILVLYTTEAFSPAPRTSLPRVSSSTVGGGVVVVGRNTVQLRASEEDEDSPSLPPLPSQKDVTPKEEPAPAPVASNDVAVEEEGTSYPIDLPSPVLLGTSMVLAISSIGSLFELTSGSPTQLGFGATAALAAIGFPFSIFLIYAAILKGSAETAEDDAEYNKPRGRL